MWGTESTRGMGEVTVMSMAEMTRGSKSCKQVKQHGALLDESLRETPVRWLKRAEQYTLVIQAMDNRWNSMSR